MKPSKPQEPKAPVFPMSYEAERTVLMAMLTQERAVPEILSTLIPDDFAHVDYRMVFKIIAGLFEKQQSIDLVTVSIACKKQPHAWSTSITDLFKDEFVSDYPTSVKELRQLSRRRRIQRHLIDGQERITGTEEVDDVVSELISNLSQTVSDTIRRPITIERATILSQKRISLAVERQSNVTGIPTGYRDFDNRIGGGQPGEVIIVGARPSMGKSALLCGIALGAGKMGYPSVIVNAEMEVIELGTRMLARESDISNINLRRGIVKDHEFKNLAAAAARLSQLPVWIYDDHRWEIIKTQIQALKIQCKNLSWVLIDYVQRIKVESEHYQREQRYEKIGRIAKESKDLAKDLQVCVVLAAQIDRAVERDNREPQLSDLRESGDLEQDADIASFLYQFPNDRKDGSDRRYWLIKKNRNGPLGNIPLRFIGNHVAYYNWSDDGDGET